MFKSLVYFFNSVPPYVGEGVLKIVLTTICLLLVGWITTRYFKQRDELTRIAGLILEKRIPIYEGLMQRIDHLNELYALDMQYAAPIVAVLKKLKVQIPPQLQIHEILLDPEKYRETFLQFEKFAIDHKLYYDEDVATRIVFLTNYMAAINHLGVHFENELQSMGISIDADVKKIEQRLYVTVGLLLKDDFFQQTEKTMSAIQNSINNLRFRYRKPPKYDYHTFSNPNGPLMKEFGQTKFVQSQQLIAAIIIEYLAMVSAMKKKKR